MARMQRTKNHTGLLLEAVFISVPPRRLGVEVHDLHECLLVLGLTVIIVVTNLLLFRNDVVDVGVVLQIQTECGSARPRRKRYNRNLQMKVSGDRVNAVERTGQLIGPYSPRGPSVYVVWIALG